MSCPQAGVGVKGAGKGGMAATPTVVNATLDAFAPLGVIDVSNAGHPRTGLSVKDSEGVAGLIDRRRLEQI